MNEQFIFNFKTDINNIDIPLNLNNPFDTKVPYLARIAGIEFQDFIEMESKGWKHDFHIEKGKMFGVLVVQKEDNSFGFIGTVSGKIKSQETCNQFVPSIFDESTDNNFIYRGMTEVTQIGTKIKESKDHEEIKALTKFRSEKSYGLQQRLFENYRFLNNKGVVQNTLQIFEKSSHGNPPAATGECAGPKLIQYAFKNNLKPIALAEFWWGTTNKIRKHKTFYPACKNKCRPILEYMLDDFDLYEKVNALNYSKHKIK